MSGSNYWVTKILIQLEQSMDKSSFGCFEEQIAMLETTESHTTSKHSTNFHGYKMELKTEKWKILNFLLMESNVVF